MGCSCSRYLKVSKDNPAQFVQETTTTVKANDFLPKNEPNKEKLDQLDDIYDDIYGCDIDVDDPSVLCRFFETLYQLCN